MDDLQRAQQLVGQNSELEKFLEWVEGTSLFEAIKKDPIGTQIHTTDGTISLSLSKNVQRAVDLPKEILQQFFINSPWYIYMTSQDRDFVDVFAKQIENGR